MADKSLNSVVSMDIEGDGGELVKASVKGIKNATEAARKQLEKTTVDTRTPEVSNNREYSNSVEKCCDDMLKANKQSKAASVGISLLAILVQCTAVV